MNAAQVHKGGVSELLAAPDVERAQPP
jgi:hypothetical protein